MTRYLVVIVLTVLAVGAVLRYMFSAGVKSERTEQDLKTATDYARTINAVLEKRETAPVNTPDAARAWLREYNARINSGG